MHKIEQMLCDELDAIADDGKLTRDSLNDIEKLTHSLKSLKTVMAMEEYSGDDYSRDYSRDYSNDYSGRMSSRRDSMGRYSRDNGNSYRNSYRSERYSRMSGDDMMGMLDQMLRDATDTKERQAIQKIMDHMER